MSNHFGVHVVTIKDHNRICEALFLIGAHRCAAEQHEGQGQHQKQLQLRPALRLCGNNESGHDGIVAGTVGLVFSTSVLSGST